MAANPGRILKVQLRPMGSVQVLETQKVGEPSKITLYDKNNQPHDSVESYFTWTLEVLVPHEDAYQRHELSFIGLTRNQYDKDKDFLNGVLSTLAYSTGTEAAASTQMSTTLSSTQPAISAPASP